MDTVAELEKQVGTTKTLAVISTVPVSYTHLEVIDYLTANTEEGGVSLAQIYNWNRG